MPRQGLISIVNFLSRFLQSLRQLVNSGDSSEPHPPFVSLADPAELFPSGRRPHVKDGHGIGEGFQDVQKLLLFHTVSLHMLVSKSYISLCRLVVL